MKRTVKRYFNMIEVALSLAIIAIGLSSILVLFPVGLNANKTAIANNNLADVAEYMIGYLRAYAIANWNDSGTSNSFLTQLNSTKPTGADTSFPADSAWKVFGTKQDGATRLKQLSLPGNNNRGVFLFQQISLVPDPSGNGTLEIPDFSAIIKVWKDNSNEFYVYDPDIRDYKKANLFSNLDRYVASLCMEISWPAEVPVQNRESKTFRFEIFNDSFKQANQIDP
ncbi:hypothetical protein HF882_02140 [Victivallis vadensis]|jgi:hypothetical protein|uniref:Uncharacterized protein n=1 Tax=Victivallis vadensis TaxID=172901 RepID=A0A848ATC8_9BACT|nr:hypothetical protein [Victivallis vadensis]NMD85377.1 hypothetical protein [Victivallis vadensis]